MATPFDINTGLIFWTLIVFGLLLVLLWRFAWPAILSSVEERERRIQKQLEEAAAARAEAQRLPSGGVRHGRAEGSQAPASVPAAGRKELP